MSDSPQIPETPKQRLSKEYEDPHFHDDDDVAPVEDGERRGNGTIKPSPRRKPTYRPPRRFHED